MLHFFSANHRICVDQFWQLIGGVRYGKWRRV